MISDISCIQFQIVIIHYELDAGDKIPVYVYEQRITIYGHMFYGRVTFVISLLIMRGTKKMVIIILYLLKTST